MRHRGKERTVGFSQQPIDRHGANRLTQLGRFRKGDDAGKRDIKTEIESGPGQRRRAGKAVPHATHVSAALLARIATVSSSASRVWTTTGRLLARDRTWARKTAFCVRNEIVMVVEADFADGAGLGSIQIASGQWPRSAQDRRQLVRLMRVDADREPGLGPKRSTCAACAASLIPLLNHHDALRPFRRAITASGRGERLVG
jgi:hypothetical protein